VGLGLKETTADQVARALREDRERQAREPAVREFARAFNEQARNRSLNGQTRGDRVAQMLDRHYGDRQPEPTPDDEAEALSAAYREQAAAYREIAEAYR
jgi:hypothetical protein